MWLVCDVMVMVAGFGLTHPGSGLWHWAGIRQYTEHIFGGLQSLRIGCFHLAFTSQSVQHCIQYRIYYVSI